MGFNIDIMSSSSSRRSTTNRNNTMMDKRGSPDTDTAITSVGSSSGAGGIKWSTLGGGSGTHTHGQHHGHGAPDSPSVNPKRKRRVSRGGITDDDQPQVAPTSSGASRSSVHPSPAAAPTGAGGERYTKPTSKAHVASHLTHHHHPSNNDVMNSHHTHHPPSKVCRKSSSATIDNQSVAASSANALSHRPRKQSRSVLPDASDAEADDLVQQRKQGLIDKLRSYATSSDEHNEDDFDSDDEGDVSGEDVFSDDDEYVNERRHAMGIGGGSASLPFSSLPQSNVQHHAFDQRGGIGLDGRMGGESQQRNDCTTYAQRNDNTSYASNKGRDNHGGVGGYHLTMADRQNHTSHAHNAEHATANQLDIELSQRQGGASQYSSNNSVRTSTSNCHSSGRAPSSAHASASTPSESSKRVFARMQCEMFEQYNNGKPMGELPTGYRPHTNQPAWPQPSAPVHPAYPPNAASSYSATFHNSSSNSGRRGNSSNSDDRSISKRAERKSRGIFANLEAEIMLKDLDDSHRSSSSSSPNDQHHYKLGREGSGSIASNGSSLLSLKSNRGGNVVQQQQVGNGTLSEASSRRGGVPVAQHVQSQQHAQHQSNAQSSSHLTKRTPTVLTLSSSTIERSDMTSTSTSHHSVSMQPQPARSSGGISHRVVSATASASASIDSRNRQHQHSRNIIANMEAIMSERATAGGGTTNSGSDGRWRSRNSLDGSNSFQQRAANARRAADGGGGVRGGSSLRGPSREVIASIEADIMRLEEEENRGRETSSLGRHSHHHGGMGSRRAHHSIGDPYGSNVRSGSTRGSRQPAGMNQRDVLSIMMMQQQQRQQQQQSQHQQQPGRPQHQVNGSTHNNGRDVPLADQISNMAIDPLNLEPLVHRRHPNSNSADFDDDDDSSNAKSINSCISYDGKCTTIFASRSRTHDQELACHALNTAICDIYGAPVGRILRQYPMVTRLIRADDETGNVQLHYAVRNGNVKAIRRIVRSDIGCALIRNIQGYCPLHFAVQIGNFAAVQQLCCMVPASAEVQCEEGCLPLHEAVSSAAHLPDAPQITAALINAFPSAIKITNDEGLLPLHLAAMSGFTAGIRTIFAYGFSTIYARENTEEMLPLDFAIEGYKTAVEEANETRIIMDNPSEESSSTSVATLTEKEMEFRQCIDIFLMSALYDRPVFTPARSDQRGMTFLPIHGAAAAQPCCTSWNQIVSMYGKDYASDVDVRGRTALHVLVTSTPLSHLDVVTKMVIDINELDPTSTTTFDDSGLIPLHAALAHMAPYHVIEHLLICNWSTISMEVDEDCDNVEYRGMLPFQLAAACGCSIDIVNMLLRAHPIGVAGAWIVNT